MQSVIISNRIILGIIAFSVSFGLSLVPKWDFNQAFVTGVITVLATYSAALFIDKRRRSHELLILTSLRKRIKEMEGLKSRIVREIEQIEAHRNLLYAESQQLQNQILECRKQRDSLHRDLGNFASQKKQLETEFSLLTTEIDNLQATHKELNNSLSTLNAEKRRLELHFNTSRTEINQLQNQINQLQQEQQELENNITLLDRIKPQLEEKLHQLRLEIESLETTKNQQNQLLRNITDEKENIAANLTALQTQKSAQQTELQQLLNELALLQQERDLLQNQVWELLQQIDNFNQEPQPENIPEEAEAHNSELFPFSDLIATLEPENNSTDTSENLPETWQRFFQQLPGHELQVLKAIVEQDNPNPAIKKIAESHITMPNLLIDEINERASNIIGELIIATDLEKPEIYSEYKMNVIKMIALYEKLIGRQASSN